MATQSKRATVAAELAQARQDLQLARLENASLAARTALSVSANYQQQFGPQQRLKRATIIPEVFPEEGLQLPYYRSQIIARARDAERFQSPVKAMLTTLENFCVGTGQNLQLTTPDTAWNKQAANWFNRVYSRDCDATGSRHRWVMDRLSLTSVIRDGDCILWFDYTGLIEPGKVFAWEADQIVELSPSDFDAKRERIAAVCLGRDLALPTDKKQYAADRAYMRQLRQTAGVIHLAHGKPVGYIVTNAHGTYTQPYAKALILPARHATLLSDPFRFGQRRGVSGLLSSIFSLTDLREIRGAVIQKMKRQAAVAGIVKREDVKGALQGRASVPDVTDPRVTPPTAPTPPGGYQRLETITDGALEYMRPGETFEAFTFGGDMPEFQQLSQHVICEAGWAIGLARFFASGIADASYSAVRGEANLSQACFDRHQQWLQDNVLDWHGGHAISWAMDNAVLPRVASFRGEMNWSGWPKLGAINPVQEAQAQRMQLQDGLTTMAHEIGPDWQAQAAQRHAEVAFNRAGDFGTPADNASATPTPPVDGDMATQQQQKDAGQ